MQSATLVEYSRSHDAVIRVYDQVAISQTQLASRYCKRPVRTVSGAGIVRSYDPEMVRGSRAQAADAGADNLVRAPGLGLEGSGVPVASRCSILKVHSRGQSVRID